jgi:seryl-tRNA synthetase
MLDIKWIRDNPKALAEALVKRGQSPSAAESAVEEVLALDEGRRAHLGELQVKQERRNAASKEIGNAMRAKDMALADTLKLEVNEIKAWLSNAEQVERDNDKALENALAVLPNIPLDDVPVGKDEHDNVEVRRFGEELIAARQPQMGNKPREHFEIGEKLGMMDFERAARLSGSRFTVLKGQLARLERALGQFMLDLHTTEHGYTEVQPPLMVSASTMYGTGQLPKFEEDLFRTHDELDEVEKEIIAGETRLAAAQQTWADIKGFFESTPVSQSNAQFYQSFLKVVGEPMERRIAAETNEVSYLRDRLQTASKKPFQKYLIPTAEVPLTNLVREEITAHGKLPIRMTALTPCFRSEAGSAGRDTRGMLRQHQFYKVELVSITDQESSLDEHERMTNCAEEVLRRLELPFRTMVLCTGDMGFGARKTYDIEVWLPGQNAYREISSCSVCGDFQARRMDARYRPTDEASIGKGTRFVHTLNGSGVAVGRALIAVIENYQNQDGSVTIPEVLKPYMGGLEKIEAV